MGREIGGEVREEMGRVVEEMGGPYRTSDGRDDVNLVATLLSLTVFQGRHSHGRWVDTMTVS